MVWFPEGAGGDRLTRRFQRAAGAHGSREALAYIQRNYLNETVIKHPDRAEAHAGVELPRMWRCEEALVNAVYHRSYEEREPVEVRIGYDELVDRLSVPGPDRSIRRWTSRPGAR